MAKEEISSLFTTRGERPPGLDYAQNRWDGCFGGGQDESCSPVDPSDPSRMPRVPEMPGNHEDTDVQTRDCARFKSTEAFGVPSRVISGLNWRGRRIWGGFGGGQVEDIDIAVIVEVEPGAGQFGVLLVGAQGDGGFAVDPLGSGRYRRGLECFAVGAGEASIVVDEVTEMVSDKITGEGFTVLTGGPARGQAGGAREVGDADGVGAEIEEESVRRRWRAFADRWEWPAAWRRTRPVGRAERWGCR